MGNCSKGRAKGAADQICRIRGSAFSKPVVDTTFVLRTSVRTVAVAGQSLVH